MVNETATKALLKTIVYSLHSFNKIVSKFCIVLTSISGCDSIYSIFQGGVEKRGKIFIQPPPKQ
jgi:hypothetical protein